MSSRRHRALVACLYLSAGLGLLACSHPAERATPLVSLQSGDVAVVGGTRIGGDMVSLVLAGRGGDPQSAAQDVVYDALLAERARADSPDRTGAVERGVLTRALRDQLIRAAASEGPMTQAELDASTTRRWLDVDRPRSVRTVHAVAVPKTPADRDKARSVAESIAAAVQGVSEPSQFHQRAAEVANAHPEVDVKIEALPPVASDGRTVPVDAIDPPSSTFDPSFSQAAAALERPGELSSVVESQFGFHVVLAVEIYPEKRVDEALRRNALQNEAFAARAERQLGPLIAQLRESTPVEISRNAEQATREAWTQ